jgi:uncharacterized membrane protein YphA (DoxX/SURF4 family)
MIEPNVLFSGLNMPEVALTVNRVALGTFFIISGYHKLFNAERHAAITATMAADRIPLVSFNSWFVPCVEFSAGLALIVGLVAPLAALGLFCVCCVATLVDGLKRIPSYNPLNRADYLADVFYLPEVLYAVMLITVMVSGGGYFSLDTLVLRWL